MERSSQLLGGASGVPEAGVARLDGRDDRQASPPALEPPKDLSVSCLVVTLAEFTGVLESAFVGEALDEHIDGLADFDEFSQGDSSHRGDSPERSEDRRAFRGAKCPICLFRLRFALGGHEIRAAICPTHKRGVKPVLEFRFCTVHFCKTKRVVYWYHLNLWTHMQITKC
jgi:hypothetical protein